MRPAEYPADAIIEAGQQLHAAGRRITGFALRQAVGGGNPARLKKIWDAHAAQQGLETEPPSVGRQPAATGEIEKLRAQLEAAVIDGREKDVLIARLRERLESVEQGAREAADEHRAQLQQLLDEKEVREGRLQEEVIQWLEAFRDSEAEHRRTLQQLSTLRAGAQTAQHRLEDTAHRLNSAESSLQQAREEAGRAREREARSDGTIATLQRQVHDLTRALAAADSGIRTDVTDQSRSAAEGGPGKK